jgi:hypothetical protein
MIVIVKIIFFIQTNIFFKIIFKNICANFAHMMKSDSMIFKIFNNKTNLA